MSQIPKTVGINIGKNSFHVVGRDERGAIVLRQKWSRGQLEARFTNMPPCLVGSEPCGHPAKMLFMGFSLSVPAQVYAAA